MICDIDRSSERGKINVDELFDRTEDCNYIQQTADNKKSYSDGTYNGRGQVVFVDTRVYIRLKISLENTWSM